MKEKPVHELEAVRAALKRLEPPPLWDTLGWLDVAREAAARGLCPWCGGDGRCVFVVGHDAARSLDGCPLCYGTGGAGDAARRVLAGYVSPEGTGILALFLRFAAEVDGENALRRALGRGPAQVWTCRKTASVRVSVGGAPTEAWEAGSYAEALRLAVAAIEAKGTDR